MPTKQEYWLGVKAGVDPANGQAIQVPLTDVEKKLYKDNAASKAKLLRYVDKTLHGPMMAASGPKESVWLIKQWFQLEFGEVTAEDSLPKLNRQKTELHPGDFKECMYYLGKLESINIKLGQIESTGKYKLDELQLKTEVLSKIPDNTDGKTTEKWAPFKAEYRKKNSLSGTTWIDFKDHLTREWKQFGSPSGGIKTGKALTVQVPGSPYFPFDCVGAARMGIS